MLTRNYDEYPYASTKQGGKGAHVESVLSEENQAVGRDFEEIYSVCNGTKREIKEQAFFDFVPGYRLMQIDEILDIYLKEFKINN